VQGMTLLHKEFLVYCTDDWSGPWILIKYIRLNDPEADDKTVQARTLAILRDLLEAGYIHAGDLVNFKMIPSSPGILPWIKSSIGFALNGMRWVAIPSRGRLFVSSVLMKGI
jgi:hypothetical protein